MASLSLHIHKLSTDPRIPDWIVDPKNESLDQWQAANVREIVRSFIMDAATPAALVEALSKAASEGEQAWRSMREENNWQDFKDHLQQRYLD